MTWMEETLKVKKMEDGRRGKREGWRGKMIGQRERGRSWEIEEGGQRKTERGRQRNLGIDKDET